MKKDLELDADPPAQPAVAPPSEGALPGVPPSDAQVEARSPPGAPLSSPAPPGTAGTTTTAAKSSAAVPARPTTLAL